VYFIINGDQDENVTNKKFWNGISIKISWETKFRILFSRSRNIESLLRQAENLQNVGSEINMNCFNTMTHELYCSPI